MATIPVLDEAKAITVTVGVILLIVGGAVAAEAFEHLTPWGLSAQVATGQKKLDAMTAKDAVDVANSNGWQAADGVCERMAQANADGAADAITGQANAATSSASHAYDQGFASGQALCPKGPPNAKAPPADSSGAQPVGVRDGSVAHDYADDFPAPQG